MTLSGCIRRIFTREFRGNASRLDTGRVSSRDSSDGSRPYTRQVHFSLKFSSPCDDCIITITSPSFANKYDKALHVRPNKSPNRGCDRFLRCPFTSVLLDLPFFSSVLILNSDAVPTSEHGATRLNSWQVSKPNAHITASPFS